MNKSSETSTLGINNPQAYNNGVINVSMLHETRERDVVKAVTSVGT